MSILGEAVEYGSPDQQAAFLDEACAGNPERRARVEALLRAYEAAGNFLQGRPVSPQLAATTDDPITERPGKGGGLYISSLASVCLDAFTLANVTKNTASTGYPNIYGSYTLC